MEGIEGMVKGLVQTYHEAGDGQKNMFAREKEVLGACPNCGGNIVKGKYGAYCMSSCGMSVNRIMGVVLTDSQVKNMLEGKKILLKGLKSKTGKLYDAYITPEGVEDYSYIKDGKEIKGSQYKFKLTFPQKKKQ